MSSRQTLTRKKKQQAFELFQQQRFAEARDLYERICQTDPSDAQAWCALSNLCGMLECHEDAIRAAQRAVTLQPDYADAHANLAAAYAALGNSSDSERHARRALQVEPKHVGALVNLGAALRHDKRYPEAVTTYESALALNPHNVEARAGLGLVLTRLGRFDDSLAHLREARRLNPGFVGTYLALGETFIALGNSKAAIEALTLATTIKPELAFAWELLGSVFVNTGKLREAGECLQRVKALSPTAPQYVAWLARSLTLQLRQDEAVTLLRDAMTNQPQDRDLLEQYMFLLSYATTATTETIFRAHTEWGRRFSPEPLQPTFKPRNRSGKPLRIGYISPDLRKHPVGYFMEPILRTHDSASFTVYCYANVAAPDDTTAILQGLNTNWRSIYGLDENQIIDIIQKDEIDILVDLAGHTAGNSISVFARKPAPVQVTYLGYPNTTGLPQMDYRLTDNCADLPDQDVYYTETLWRLPGGFLCYQPPRDAPNIEPSPHRRRGHITFGCFNAVHKINPALIELWSLVLLATPNSKILLKERTFRDAPTCEIYVSQFARHGITRDRIEFVGWVDSDADHLASYHRVDIALDTFPYCGTTTTCEALWMGVPVITLAGERHIERVGASILTHTGMPEFIAACRDEYVAKAAALAADPAMLATLRNTQRARLLGSPLCDATAFTRDLESAYREMWRRYASPQTA